MSNIINDKSNLLIIKSYLNDLLKNGLFKAVVEEILKELLPNKDGELLVDYKVIEKGVSTAIFIPSTKSIDLSLNKINEWLDKNTNDILQNLKSCDANTLRSYLFLFMITHEIEHSYQYLMGEGLIDAPNDVLKNAYKELFDLMIPKHYIIPRPISETRRLISIFLYKLNQNFYLLERNANIESMDLVSEFALFNNRDDIFQLFNDMKNTYLKCGYINNGIGSIEETYRNILMYDKYKRFYQDIDLTEEDRIKYGFSVSEETRKRILKRN